MSRQPTGAYSVAMLAERWGVSTTFVYSEIERGKLRAFKLGAKLIRISKDAVEEYEKAGETAQPAPEPVPEAGLRPNPAQIGRLIRTSMN